MSEVRMRQERLTRRLPLSAPCLVSETVARRRVSTMELVAAFPDSNCVSRPGHRPFKNSIPDPALSVPHPSRAAHTTHAPLRAAPGRLRVLSRKPCRTSRPPAESVPSIPTGSHPPGGHFALAFLGSSALLRRTEDQKDQAIRTTPTRPVMISLISYWIVTSRMAASAPIA